MKKFLYALLKSAARFYLKRTKPFIIGVTGSVGKTSCRMIVSQTLQKTLIGTRISTSPKNFNSEIGLCLSILEIKEWSLNPFKIIWTVILAWSRALFGSKRYDVLMAEYGIDGEGDMDYLLSIAVPNIAIFTVLDTVHALQMGTPDEILKEKSKLLKAAKEIVFVSVPAMSYLRKVVEELSTDVLSYAFHETESEEADIRWRNRSLVTDDAGLPMAQFTVEQGKDSVTSLSTNLLGATDAGYISLGIECASIIAVRLSKSIKELEKIDHLEYDLQPGRLSILNGKWGSVIIDSSYNGAPKSMKETIATVISLRNELYNDFNLVYCLGDMRELGDFSEKEHRTLAGYISQSADAIYLVGNEMRQYTMDELIKVGFNPDNIFWFESSSLLGKALDEDLPDMQKRSVVLFKGSQNTIFMEEGVKQILQDPADKKKLVRQGGIWIKKKMLSIIVLLSCTLLFGCTHSNPIEVLEGGPMLCFEQEGRDCFSIEIAETREEQQKGLMYRESLGYMEGMLFVFNDNRLHRFWMKNTLIPLDMIWFNENRVVTHIETDVQPCPEGEVCPTYGPEGNDPTAYVLELNAGMVESFTIEVGDSMTYY